MSYSWISPAMIFFLFKQVVKLFIPCRKGIEFLLFFLPFLLRCLYGMSHHNFCKFRFILRCQLCEPPDFTEHNLFQKVYPDIMGRGTYFTFPSVVTGTIKILDFRVALIEVVP